MDAIPFDFRQTCRKGIDALLLVAPLVLCLLLLARRGAGALVEPLPLAGWLLAGLLAVIWLRWSALWLPERFATSGAARLPVAWLPPAIAALLGLALWLPGTRLSAVLAYAAIVIAGSSPRIAPDWRRLRPTRLRWPLDRPFQESSADLAGEDNALASAMGPAVIQQLIRRRESGEAESLRGSVRADFVAGQRIASAHVAICPPFVGAPLCQVAVAAGPQAEVRVASALPFGVRFEIKLAQATPEPASVVVEFSVDSTDGDLR